MPAPTSADIAAFLLWYALAFSTLGLAEWLHRRRGWPAGVTRKLVHLAAGSSIFVILLLFDHPFFGLIPFASFTLANYWFRRRRTFRSVDSGQATYGTVYFALSITILLVWFWRPGPADRSPLAAAAVMMMTWGDAAAALVGERIGRHVYQVFGGKRTAEGSVAMATTAALSGAAALGFYGGFAGGAAIRSSLLAAAAATLAEALSPHGLDNLSVPLVAAAVLAYLL